MHDAIRSGSIVRRVKQRLGRRRTRLTEQVHVSVLALVIATSPWRGLSCIVAGARRRSRVGNSTENVFDLFTQRTLSHEAKDGGRIFLPVRDLDFENLDRPVAEWIMSGFRNSP